MDLFLL